MDGARADWMKQLVVNGTRFGPDGSQAEAKGIALQRCRKKALCCSAGHCNTCLLMLLAGPRCLREHVIF
jgi:hypothetical protein